MSTLKRIDQNQFVIDLKIDQIRSICDYSDQNPKASQEAIANHFFICFYSLKLFLINKIQYFLKSFSFLKNSLLFNPTSSYSNEKTR